MAGLPDRTPVVPLTNRDLGPTLYAEGERGRKLL